MEWFDKENLQLAYKYLLQEFDRSSLPLEPLWKPTVFVIDQIEEKYFETLSEYIKSGYYKPDDIDYVYATKPKSELRPIAVMSTTDRIIYQAILNRDQLASIIDDKLLNICCSYRVYGREDGEYLFAKYQFLWNKFFNQQIDFFSKGYKFHTKVDIKSFFKLININKLTEILKEEFGVDDQLINILKLQLKKWNKNRSGLGIPQGPSASHVLANAYLTPFDKYFNNLSVEEKNFKILRYVDDIVVMASSESTAKSIVFQINRYLQDEYNLEACEKSELTEIQNINELKNERLHEVSGGCFIPSIKKLDKARQVVPKIIEQIDTNDRFDNRLISHFKYFIKAERDKAFIDDVIKISDHTPFLISDIVRYANYYVNNNYVFQKFKSKYENKFNDDWNKFWIVKFLCNSILMDHNENYEIVNGIKNSDLPYYIKLVAYYYEAEKRSLEIEDDNLRYLIDNSSCSVEKSNYIFLTKYLNGNFNGYIDDCLRSESVDLQLIGLYLNDFKNIENKKLSNFSKVFIGKKTAKSNSNKKQGREQVHSKTNINVKINNFFGNGYGEVVGVQKKNTNEKKKKKRKKKTENGIKFEGDILYLMGKEINFNNKPNQKNLLTTLFKNPRKKWDNDEIWEDWGEQDLIGKTNMFYTAGYEINKIVKEETSIKIFLNLSTKQIFITPKLLDNIR